MDWLLRLAEAPRDALLRARAQAWSEADPDHGRAWRQAVEAYRLAGAARPVLAHLWAASAERARPAPARLVRRRVALGLASAVAASLAFVLAAPLLPRLGADHATGTAEVRSIPLEDGSVVHLAPESAIAADMTQARRTITLLAGEAYFEVAPDSARPFTVVAGDIAAQALGTAFNVALEERAVSVAVQEGTVQVSAQAPPDTVRLGAGDAARFDPADGQLRHLPGAAGDVAAWREGILFVEDATVAEVVAALRPYRRGWIVLADDALAARRVTGLYALDDPDRALRALVEPAGGTVRELTPLLVLLTGR